MMIFCVYFSLKQRSFASFFCLVITVFSLMNEAVRFHSRASIKIKFLTSHLSFYLNVYSNKRFFSLHCFSISSREQRACNRGSARMQELVFFQMEELIASVRDQNLKLTLAFGIGLHHAGLHERDRKTVEELFVNSKIQV